MDLLLQVLETVLPYDIVAVVAEFLILCEQKDVSAYFNCQVAPELKKKIQHQTEQLDLARCNKEYKNMLIKMTLLFASLQDETWGDIREEISRLPPWILREFVDSENNPYMEITWWTRLHYKLFTYIDQYVSKQLELYMLYVHPNLA